MGDFGLRGGRHKTPKDAGNGSVEMRIQFLFDLQELYFGHFAEDTVVERESEELQQRFDVFFVKVKDE